jgi:hypothetical protein
MTRLITSLSVAVGLAVVTTAVAADAGHERIRPPFVTQVVGEAQLFYIEFRARDAKDGFGHSYVTLGAFDARGRRQQTVILGFNTKTADDDYWSLFAVPVTGVVGVTRADLVQQPDVYFRVSLSKSKYDRVVRGIPRLQRDWTMYQLLARNCNSFVGHVAQAIDLSTPLLTAQFPTRYVLELKALNTK